MLYPAGRIASLFAGHLVFCKFRLDENDVVPDSFRLPFIISDKLHQAFHVCPVGRKNLSVGFVVLKVEVAVTEPEAKLPRYA